MTNKELVERTKIVTDTFCHRIEEKGNDDILIKSFYFNQLLTHLIDINERLILSEEQEILGFLSKNK